MALLHAQSTAVETPVGAESDLPDARPGRTGRRDAKCGITSNWSGWALVAVLAAIAANYAHDLAYMVNAITVMLAAGAGLSVGAAHSGRPEAGSCKHEYLDGVVRAGVIATAFWGVVGFLVGVVIAFQLAFPQLNFEFLQGFGNFGRLRPLHTSAVIFAFGGNALIMTFVLHRPAHQRRAAVGRQPWLVRVLGLAVVDRAGRDRLCAGRRPRARNMPNRSGMSTSGSPWSGSPSCWSSWARC